MEQCWDREELNRPTFNTLHEILQELSTSEDLSSHVSLQNIDLQCPYYHPRRHHGSGVKDGKATEEDITRQKDEIVHDILSQTEPDAHRMNSVSTNTGKLNCLFLFQKYKINLICIQINLYFIII